MRRLFFSTPLVAAILAGCAASDGTAGAVAQAGRGERPALRLTLSSDRAAYAVGQPVKLTLTVENTGGAPLVVTTPTAQLYDFAVFRGGQEVWRWSGDRGFATQIMEWTLAPGQRREFSETWHPAAGSQTPGDYTVVATLAGGQLLGAQPLRLTFPVR
jgi:hypothetical protein